MIIALLSGVHTLALLSHVSAQTSIGYVNRPPAHKAVLPPVPTPPHMPTNPAILREYMRLGGPAGPMGKPLSPDTTLPNHNGSLQVFDNGTIVTANDVWPGGVVAAYQDSFNSIQVDWFTNPDADPEARSGVLNFDKFLVEWDLGGQHHSDWQAAIHEHNDSYMRTCGNYNLGGLTSGVYTIRVEGADDPVDVNVDGFHLVDSTKSRQGFMPNIYLRVDPNRQFGTYPGWGANVTAAPPATTVADSRAHFDDRTAASVLYLATKYLPQSAYGHEASVGAILLAKLAYADYFQDPRLPGRNYTAASEAISYLGKQKHSDGWHVGTDEGNIRKGEYDTFLISVIPAIYKYWPQLPPDVRANVLGSILAPVLGSFNGNDELPNAPLPPSETENHLYNIETSRYLANQLAYQRAPNPTFDNDSNGTTDWLLSHLHSILVKDFTEYNARPYQDYSITSILNLYSFADVRTKRGQLVKNAAEMVLDYLMAKAAVSVDDSRRWTGFRRHATEPGYRDSDFLGLHSDPMNAYTMTLAGTTDMVNNNILPFNFAGEFLSAGLSDYRIPDEILDLMINRTSRRYLQAFHHASDEIYAGSPSYTIMAGGRYAPPAYTVAGFGKADDTGKPMATVLMPFGQGKNKNQLIRFEGNGVDDAVSPPVVAGMVGANVEPRFTTVRWNLGVTTDFACGLVPVIPSEYTPYAASADLRGVFQPQHSLAGPWTFINQDGLMFSATSFNQKPVLLNTGPGKVPSKPSIENAQIKPGQQPVASLKPPAKPPLPGAQKPPAGAIKIVPNVPLEYAFDPASVPQVVQHCIGTKVDTYPTGYKGARYFIAIYHQGDFGFMELYDLAVEKSISFGEFVTGVLHRNVLTHFTDNGPNTYVMTNGNKVLFQCGPTSVIHAVIPASQSNLGALAAAASHATAVGFLNGTVMNSSSNSGYVTIENPHMPNNIILDFRNPSAPARVTFVRRPGFSPTSFEGINNVTKIK